MNLTLEEAKELYCPFMQGEKCWTNKCMAWEWTEFKIDQLAASKELKQFLKFLKTATQIDVDNKGCKKVPKVPVKGICGYKVNATNH